jgi:biotin carboxylase
LRRAWRIAGQTVESALAYRDKNLMKRTLAAAGLPVARFAAVDDATDLLGFVGRTGLPVVVKPRRGASSAGVRVLRTEADLHAFLGPGSAVFGDSPADLQVEEYLEHEMYNVDGLVVDGQVRVCWPSWTTSGLGFQHGEGQLAVTLEAGEPWQQELVELVGSVLRTLPTPATTIFHAEVFRTRDDRLVFNEIGCRIGGARIWDQLRVALEVDLLANYIKGSYGRPGSVNVPHHAPVTQAGWVLIVARPGKIASVPEQCPLPGVAIYDPYVAVGDLVGPPADVTEASAAVVARGATRAEVEATLRRSVEWFQGAVDYVLE